MNTRKILSVILAAILVVNLILFAMKILTVPTFWLVIVISAIAAYVILPRIKK